MKQTALTDLKATFLHPIPATKNVTIRKSVYDLSDAEVLALRKAYAAIQALTRNDHWSYQYINSIHGINQNLCPHGNQRFAIWHRPYVLNFEQALQRFAPGLGMPYWDWTTKKARTEGIPLIFSAPMYTDPVTHQPVPNPLYSAVNSYLTPPAATTRNPGPPAALGSLVALVQLAMQQKTYDTFWGDLENPHNQVHGWVGGSMGSVPTAAFDPLFWAHHCFCEKIFCDWQDFQKPAMPAWMNTTTLNPYNTANQYWDYKALGYRYQPDSSTVVASPRKDLLLAKAVNLSPSVAHFSLEPVPDEVHQAELNFVKTEVPKDSFEVRVFFNEQNPTAQTPTAGNPKFVGSLFTFGHGECFGGEDHCKVPVVPEDATLFASLRPPHHLTPRLHTMDVKKAVQAAKAAKAGQIDVQLVLVDPHGKPLPPDSFNFEQLTLNAV